MRENYDGAGVELLEGASLLKLTALFCLLTKPGCFHDSTLLPQGSSCAGIYTAVPNLT